MKATKCENNNNNIQKWFMDISDAAYIEYINIVILNVKTTSKFPLLCFNSKQIAKTPKNTENT